MITLRSCLYMDMSLDRHSHIAYRSEVLDHERIKNSIYEIDTKRIRCFLQANKIESGWQGLVDDGFPLGDIASTLVFMENCGYILKKQFNVLKFPIHVLRLVDSIVACKSIRGFDKRYNSLNSRLTGIINNSRFIPSPTYKTLPEYHNDLTESLLSATGEFRIACALRSIESSLKFTDVQDPKYPDFSIGNYKTARGLR
jgi:hypothetical protein